MEADQPVEAEVGGGVGGGVGVGGDGGGGGGGGGGDDVPVAEPLPPLAPSQRISLSVLEAAKLAQAQNGLKHGDYSRYRKYCTRRLRRLYVALSWTHSSGSGRRAAVFSPRPLTADTARAALEACSGDARILQIPLVAAERAWSHALELREEGGGGSVSRKRHHLVRLLKRATDHASTLSAIAVEIADSQTQVEAEAYAQAIRGTYLLEQERDWETALSALVRARDLYKELGTLGIGGAAALCRQRAVELEPSIRFCSYRLARARGNDGASGGELEVEMVSGDVDSVMGNRMEQLKRQLQEERAASMSAGGGADSGDGGPSSMDLRFLDVCAPCVSQELAVHLVRVGDALGQVMAQKREQGGAKIEKEQRQAAVEKIVTNLDNATLELGAARDEVHEQLEAAKRAGAGQAATAELASAELVLRARLGVITLQRNIYMTEQFEGKVQSVATPGQQSASTRDLLRVFDLAVQAASDLRDVAISIGEALEEQEKSSVRARALVLQADVLGEFLRARRCVAAATWFVRNGSYLQSLALALRGAERASSATAFAKKLASMDVAMSLDSTVLEESMIDAPDIDTCQSLENKANSLSAVAHARAAYNKVSEQEQQSGGASRDDEDLLRSWSCVDNPKTSLADVPPVMRPTAVRPLVLDVAMYGIDDDGTGLAQRIAKEKAAAASASTLVGTAATAATSMAAGLGRMFGFGKKPKPS